MKVAHNQLQINFLISKPIPKMESPKLHPKTERARKLLNEFTPRGLLYCKSYAQARRMLQEHGVESKKIKYLVDNKLKHHGKDFAGMYCNQDRNHQPILLEALGIYLTPPPNKFPEDWEEKEDVKFEIMIGELKESDYYPLEVLFVHDFCTFAYNENPITFLSEEISEKAVDLFKKSQLRNYGCFEVWAKFWGLLDKHKQIEMQDAMIQKMFKYLD